jgi:hypothetical protein
MDWVFVQIVRFWAIAVLKFICCLMVLAVIWLTLWARQLRKGAALRKPDPSDSASRSPPHPPCSPPHQFVEGYLALLKLLPERPRLGKAMSLFNLH